VGEDDSWADQSKIRQFNSRFDESVSFSNVSVLRVFKNSCKSVQKAAQKASQLEVGGKFAASMPKSKTEKIEADKKLTGSMHFQTGELELVNEIPARNFEH